jgi:hypothetical protein
VGTAEVTAILSSYSAVTGLRAGQSAVGIPAGSGFIYSAKRPDRLWDHPVGTALLPHGRAAGE